MAGKARPVVEPADLGALHLLDLARRLTAATSPALVVEVRVVGAHVRVFHWLWGEPFWVAPVAGRA